MRTLYLFPALLLLYACSSNTPKTWEQTKMAGLAYPKDSIRIDSVTGLGGGSEILWLNLGYLNYPNKDFCKYHITLRYDRKDSSIEVMVKQDPLLIQKLLLYHLRQHGVAHVASQVLTPVELVIDLYTENLKNPIGIVSEFSIPGKAVFNEDPKWSTFESLLK